VFTKYIVHNYTIGELVGLLIFDVVDTVVVLVLVKAVELVIN